ncbi:hypothetical protein [Roseisolibacter agri]|uniref:hypothetical protein n=1 Tax=Roseisolibacter agri TaxID=2014610 RepID=UPI0024E0C473|nr:hypothetical protein [Roseisolibacter agri]
MRAPHAPRAATLLAVLALARAAVAGAQATVPTTFASAVPTPAPLKAPDLAAPAVRVVDLAPDGQERGWLGVELQRVQSGLAVSVSRSALRIASPNARVVAVRAILADADTTHGWKVRAVSLPVAAAKLVGCVDGRLANTVRLDIPTSGADALRGTRLAFELVGQVRAPGERRWSRVSERRIAGPVLAGIAP